MKFEDMDLSELPPSLAQTVDRQSYLWDGYSPTTIEKDIPFNSDWWKYVYWIPKIKKEFYTIAIREFDMERALQAKCNSLGIDYWWFTKHYKDFFKRLEWMRKNNNYNHIGETE